MQLEYKTYLLTGLYIVLGGCASPQISDELQLEPSPLVKDITNYHSLQVTAADAFLLADIPTGEITLRKALSLALVKNPELAAFSWEVRAQEARALQAGLFPNPELSIEAENFGGSSVAQGFSTAENTVALSQIIKLGGKRKKRSRRVTLNQKLAGWDYETKRLAVLTEVTKLFVEVLAAQERLVLTGQLVNLSERVYSAVTERVKTGKVSPVEETRAWASLSTVRIESERSKRKLESAIKRLAYTWGSSSGTSIQAIGELEDIEPIPSAEQLVQVVSQNPDIGRWNDEISQRQAALELEKSRRIPDLSFSGGSRRLNETDINAFVLEMSLPLTFFNRNQGSIMEAHYRVAKAEEERRTAELGVLSRLAESYESLIISYSEATALRNDVLPSVESAFDAVIAGYDQGKFGYLDVLDAQRTLFEARDQYIEMLATYHKAKADMERLIGQSIDSVGKSTEEN